MNTLKKIRSASFRALSVLALVGFFVTVGVFVAPHPAKAVIDLGCTSCGGGFGGFGGFFPGTVTHQLDGGGGGGGYEPTPYCTITANPNPSPTVGGAVTLTWTATHSTTATIDNGVGNVTPVNGGTVVVHPTVNTTYTLTTDGVYGGATCQVTVPVPPPPSTGCIQVLKETYDTDGNILTPVAQFTFTLDGSQTALNDASGNAIFNNVPAGAHIVTEAVPPTWTQLSVTPTFGAVIVSPGPVCAAVVFKNKQVITNQNSCPVPSSLNDTSVQVVQPAPSGEQDLQAILNAASFSLNVNADQKEFQNWTVTSGQSLTVNAQYISHYSAYDQVFGYYMNGNLSTFVPVFKTASISGYASVPLASAGPFNITTNVSGTIGFAIKSYQGGVLKGIQATENSLNQSGSDQVVAYNPASGTYVLGFEDRVAFDNDYNDLVVKLNLGCTTFVPAPTCTLNSDKDSISPNEPVTLTWTSTNAVTGEWVPGGDNAGINGSATFTNVTTDTLFKIKFTGPGGTVTCEKPVTVPPPTPKGCIQIKKETYNTANQIITPVAQFTFKLDGNAATTQNDANGNAIFNDVSVGVHTVSEIVPATWTQLSITPVNGTVTVSAGPTCSAVVFKNKQVITTPPPVTVQATKIVCDAETDLPNRSGGAHITSTTATDFLATHPNCHLQPNWVFEWANENVNNPGDNIGAGGSGWNVFAPTNGNGTTTIAIPAASITGGKIWVREQMDNSYIPFTGALGGNVSPEMYCSTDVLNYDNYDFIGSPASGQTYYCVAWNVKKPTSPNTPSCTLHANPNSLTSPNNSTLTWTTSNATSFTIDHNIGSVTPVPGGSTTTPVAITTTYTGTATGPGGTATCSDTVTITTTQNGPRCQININKSQINSGDSVIVSWTASDVTEGFIDHNIGTTTPVLAGSQEAFPPVDTTYFGTFKGPDGTVTCSADVRVITGGGSCQGNCGGGGYNQPNVVMYSKPGDSGLVASVFLSQIPYTGFEAGPMLTALFWLAVALLAALIAYFAAGRQGMNLFSNHLAAYVGVPTAQELRNAMGTREENNYDSYDESYTAEVVHEVPQAVVMQSVAAPARPVSAPIVSNVAAQMGTGIPSIADVIETRAHAAGVLMSPESVKIASEMSTDRAQALQIFGEVLNEAVKTIPREDGWIMLTSDKLEDLAEKAQAKITVQPVMASAVAAPVTPAAVSEVRTYTYGERADEASAVAFVTAIVSGNRDAAFGIIRSLEHDAVSPATLMTSTATVLDRLYRVRQGGKNGIDQELVSASVNVSDETLHKLVEVFAHALDIVYTNPFTGVKLALAQAFEVVG